MSRSYRSQESSYYKKSHRHSRSKRKQERDAKRHQQGN